MPVADSLSPLYTIDGEETALEDDVPVLTVLQALVACAPHMEIIEFQFVEELKDLLAVFISEICMISGITDNEKA